MKLFSNHLIPFEIPGNIAESPRNTLETSWSLFNSHWSPIKFFEAAWKLFWNQERSWKPLNRPFLNAPEMTRSTLKPSWNQPRPSETPLKRPQWAYWNFLEWPRNSWKSPRMKICWRNPLKRPSNVHETSENSWNVSEERLGIFSEASWRCLKILLELPALKLL